MTRAVLDVRDVTKIYGTGEATVHALRGVSLTVQRGDYVAIMGSSGSGKSTLMNILGALDVPSSGTYLLDGVDVSRLADRQLALARNRLIGFIFQAFNLIPRTSAVANVELPLAYAGVKPRRRRERAMAALEAVGLADRARHEPNQLSGGQQQRVAVARALAGRPEIVFADEPTGNLDSRAGAEILGFLRRAVDGMGQTVVMVTHDPVAAAYADRVLFLADGRIVDQMDGPTEASVLDKLKSLGD